MPIGNVDLMDRLRALPALERLSREDLVRAVYLRDRRTLPQDFKRLLETISVIRIRAESPEDVVEAVKVATGEVAGVSLGLTADSLHYVRTRLAMMKDREVAVDWAPREDPFDSEIVPHLDGFQVDLSALKAVDLNEDVGVVRCEAGATWWEVYEACSEKGWLLPVFPMLPYPCYVGDIVGGTSTLASFKGGPEAYLRNVDYISPDGHYCESGFDLVPNSAAGYDLNSLMMVMGRHIAIPISLTFALIPLAPVQKTLRYMLDDLEALTGALTAVLKSRIQPLKILFGDALGSEVALGKAGNLTVEIVIQGTEESVAAQQKRLDAAFPEGAQREEVEGIVQPLQRLGPGQAPAQLAEIRANLADVQPLMQDLASWLEEQGPDFGLVGSLSQGGTVALVPFINRAANRGERFDRLLELLHMSRRHGCRLRDNHTVHLLSPETNLEKRFALVRRIKERVDLPNVINPSSLMWIPQAR
jgi:hypothetical protein